MSEITVEKSRAITVIAAATIVALAMGVGLAKVGTGFASRATSGITVTGSAKTSATADKAVWILTVQQLSPSAPTAVAKVTDGVNALTKYLTAGGVKESELTYGGISTYANEEYQNGNSTGRILSYRANRDVTVRTANVQLVAKLSQNIGSLLQTGVNINNYGPQYYISNLPALRPKLAGDAMKDALARAKAITKSVNGKTGKIMSVKSGPIQVTAPDSTVTADFGAYETQTIEKTVTATISVTFATN
jgi:hypothetical protein